MKLLNYKIVRKSNYVLIFSPLITLCSGLFLTTEKPFSESLWQTLLQIIIGVEEAMPRPVKMHRLLKWTHPDPSRAPILTHPAPPLEPPRKAEF